MTKITQLEFDKNGTTFTILYLKSFEISHNTKIANYSKLARILIEYAPLNDLLSIATNEYPQFTNLIPYCDLINLYTVVPFNDTMNLLKMHKVNHCSCGVRIIYIYYISLKSQPICFLTKKNLYPIGCICILNWRHWSNDPYSKLQFDYITKQYNIIKNKKYNSVLKRCYFCNKNTSVYNCFKCKENQIAIKYIIKWITNMSNKMFYYKLKNIIY